MNEYRFIDEYGSFRMEKPEQNSYLYFPLAGESGLKSSITPLLLGDCKVDQNTFLLQPVSAEELHNLKSSRNFWCVLEDGKVWSAAGNSVWQEALRGTKKEEESVLEAGLMWHKMSRTSRVYPISSEITSFVPSDECTFEVMQVTVKNTGAEELRFTPVAAVPLYCRSADNIRDHRHVTSLLHRCIVREEGVEVTPTLTFDERGHKKNEITYFVYGTEEGKGPQLCCPSVQDFIGEGGSFQRPLSLLENFNGEGKETVWVKAGTCTEGEEVVGALRFAECCLSAGEEKTYNILFGLTKSEHTEEIRNRLAREYGSTEGVKKALKEMTEEWREKVNVHYETGDAMRDGYLYWVTFQPLLRRIYGCSFLPHHDYGKGGRGWRDLWQDCLALLVMEPEKVRKMLVDNYGGVRMDGTNATIIGQNPGEFIADRNHIARVWMDHGLWPFITTQLYIHTTGDLEILREEVPYFKDTQIFRGEKRDKEWTAKQGTKQRYGVEQGEAVAKGTILEHILLQNITAFYDVGEHNHIRLRGADWNDGFDMAEEYGESVAFTAAYAGNLEELAELLEEYARKQEKPFTFHKELEVLLQGHGEIYDSKEKKQRLLETYYESCASTLSGERIELSARELSRVLREMADWIKEHIRSTEWITTTEGSFYNGYYDNHKRPLEGSFPEGIRMTLTGQVFTIMSKTATKEQTAEIAKAADRLLYREELGGYRLNTNFKEVKDDMGRAFGFAYGHKENGAVFSHMAVMYANALYKQGFIKEGHKALEALYQQSVNFPVSRIYPGLPEYFDHRGRGMYAYLTGSASWFMLTMVTQVYGVKGEYGNLRLEPKLLEEQLDENGETSIRVNFAGVSLHIRYRAKERKRVYDSAKEICLDGEWLEGSLIPKEKLSACPKGQYHSLQVIL